MASMDELEAVFEKILVLAETHAVVLSGNPLLAELHIADRLTALNKFVTSWASPARGLRERIPSLTSTRPVLQPESASRASISCWRKAAPWC